MITLFKNGTIVDGTGKVAFKGDLVVKDDKIECVSVQSLHGGTEATIHDRVVDCTGKLVCPGFIDAHTHSDAYLILEPDAPSKLSQGITTEINGQCGGSVAPRYGEARLSSDWAALLGEKLTWRSMAEYRETLEKVGPAVNTVQFVGHNTLRSSVVGYAGRLATEDELRNMEYLLDKSLEEGGYGLTTGLIYQPGKYSNPEEVKRLAKIAAKKGGYYATHMRSEGDRILEAIDEVLELVRESGIKAEISHLKTSGKKNWHKIDAVLEKIETAIERGELLGSDRYPFTAAGTDLDVVFPDWAGEGAVVAECIRLKDERTRTKIIEEINASGRDWSTVMIGGTWHEDNKRYCGKYISELTDNPGEFICRVLEKDGCKTGAFFFGMSEANLDKILARPWIVPGSDASLRAPWGPLGADHPHPRAYATMPEFFARVKALGISKEEAISRMSKVPAERFALKGRGTLKNGNFADIVVIDEDNFMRRSTFTDPHQFSSGVELVMVNGVISYENGKFTGKRAGRFLTRC